MNAPRNTISAREVRLHWSEVVGRVRYGGERLVVTKHGAPRIAVVPLEDLQKLRRLDGGKPKEFGHNPLDHTREKVRGR